MSNAINKNQLLILLQRMQENPGTARGYTKETKEAVSSFWNNVNKELNSAGPPVKSIFEWKKVWTDQKRYVRKKAAENVKHRGGTGGGPNKTKPLSNTEEAIYDLVNVKEAVEGVLNSCTFGMPMSPSSQNKENELPPNLDVMDKNICEPSNEMASLMPSTSRKRKREDSRGKLTTGELIDKEVKTQEKLCSKMCELIDMVKEDNKDMKAVMKRMCRRLEKMNDQKVKNFKENERNNAVMENYKKMEVESKLEKNKKLIEIEEMKLAIMNRNEL